MTFRLAYEGFCLFNISEKNSYTKNWDTRKHWFSTDESTRLGLGKIT